MMLEEVVDKLQALGQAIDIEAVSMVANGTTGKNVAERLTGETDLKLGIGVGLQLPQARFLAAALWLVVKTPERGLIAPIGKNEHNDDVTKLDLKEAQCKPLMVEGVA